MSTDIFHLKASRRGFVRSSQNIIVQMYINLGRISSRFIKCDHAYQMSVKLESLSIIKLPLPQNRQS